MVGARLSTLMGASGPATRQLPATSQTSRLAVVAVAVSTPAGTEGASRKLASRASASPDPESEAVHPRLTSAACQPVSGAAQFTTGGVVSALAAKASVLSAARLKSCSA